MTNVGMAGFDMYRKRKSGELKTPIKEDLIEYFGLMFYHVPTDEQLEMFHNYLIGKERDVQKVIEFCEQSQAGGAIEKQ